MNAPINKLRVAAVAILAAIALAACGGAATSSTATNAPAATSAPAASAATSAPAATAAEPATSGATAEANAPTAAAGAAATTAPEATAAPAEAAAVPAKLNLNDVTEDQLLSTIPNFGNRMVREFFEYRPYVSIQQFRREIGKYVSAEQVAAYEQYVYVPIDVDAADADTLQQIPGVDANEAAELIAGRPYGSNQAFLDKLSSYVEASDLSAAQSYLAAK
ncbi:MAG TPA: hypothetical protein VFX76_08345 [Roseiflexaceae bacterium]|nr:hypothetical protein [Roseiflexaceae bacterium]